MPDPLLVLSWRAPADPGAALRRRIHAWSRARLRALFSRSAPAAELAAFEEAISALPASSRRRLLGAPELIGRLALDLESDPGFYLELLEAEQVRIGRSPPPRSVIWTALGDAVYGPVPAITPAHLPQGSLLDGVSPWARARLPGVVLGFEPYTPEELASLVGRVMAAGHQLQAWCPEASALVAGFTRTVLLRKDPDHPERWLSESTEGTLGRTLLVNAQRSGVDGLDLVEALVHEAVHAWLGALELGAPFVPDRERAPQLMTQSPWTGHVLDAERCVHAAFVWFAVGHLWRRVEGLGVGAAGARAERAEAGFRGLMPSILDIEPVLSPAVRATLGRLAASGLNAR